MRRSHGTAPASHPAGWGRQAEVVPSDALEREIEPVRDLPEAPAGLVDGPLAVDPVAREDHHAADRVADGHERFVLFLGKQLGMCLSESPPRERRDDRVAGQEELAKCRAVMQVGAAPRVIQVEERATWQRLAPQELVVPAERGAVRVRVLLRESGVSFLKSNVVSISIAKRPFSPSSSVLAIPAATSEGRSLRHWPDATKHIRGRPCAGHVERPVSEAARTPSGNPAPGRW